MLLAPMTIRVGSGSCRFTDANMFWNVGITKMSSTVIAMAATDVVHHLAGDAGEDLVLGLLRQDVEGLHQWQAGIDHRGELPREHDDVAHRDAAAELEIDLELARRGADLHHDHAVLAQVRDDIIAAR